MSSIAVALKHMLAAEMPHEAILAAVEEMELGVHSPSSDDSKERRRAWDRERKRSAKMRKIAEFPVENVEIPQRVSPKEIPPTPPKEITPSPISPSPPLGGFSPTVIEFPLEAVSLASDTTAAKVRSKGSRLSPGWSPSEADRQYAEGRGFGSAHVAQIGEKFRNYWTAKAGRDAAKLDWPATWRNWVLTEAERSGVQPANLFTETTDGRPPPPTDPKFLERQRNYARALEGAKRAAASYVPRGGG